MPPRTQTKGWVAYAFAVCREVYRQYSLTDREEHGDSRGATYVHARVA